MPPTEVESLRSIDGTGQRNGKYGRRGRDRVGISQTVAIMFSYKGQHAH